MKGSDPSVHQSAAASRAGERTVFLIDLRAIDALATPSAAAASPGAAIDDCLFDWLGACRLLPPVRRLDPWWQSARLDWLRDQARAIVANCHVLSGDARRAFTLPFWRSALPPDSTSACMIVGGALPIEHHDGVDTARGRALWQAYTSAALLHTTDTARTLIARPGQNNTPHDLQNLVEHLEHSLAGTELETAAHALHRTETLELLAPARHTASSDATARNANPLSPLQLELATAVHNGGRVDRDTILTECLVEAQGVLERHLLEDVLDAHEKMGSQVRAHASTHRALGECEQRRSAMQTDLATVEEEVAALRAKVQRKLGDWCDLDRLEQRQHLIKSFRHRIGAVRNSWTYRIARALGAGRR